MIETAYRSSPVAQLRNISLQLGERWIFRQLSLSIPATDCSVLLGPSGTGKSTLLRLLTGQIQRHPLAHLTGKVAVAGLTDDVPTIKQRPPAIVEQKAALLVSSVWASMVSDWPRRGALTQAQQRSALAKILTSWGQGDLIERWNDTVVDLDKADQVRVAIVRVALSDAPLLLLDEPTANLRDADAQSVLRLIQVLKSQVPILVVTHHLAHARQIADHILLIASGALQEQTPATEFFESPRSESGRAFLLSGSCPEQPVAAPADIDSSSGRDECHAASAALAPFIPETESLSASSSALAISTAWSGSAGQPSYVVHPAVTSDGDGLEAPLTSGTPTVAFDVADGMQNQRQRKLPQLLEQASSPMGEELSAGQGGCDATEVSVALSAQPIGSLIRTSSLPIPAPVLPGPRGRGPRGFTWLIEGKLAGTPWPGIVADMDDDLRALREAGVTHLFSLTETPFPVDRAGAWGLSCSAYPMLDMTAPDLMQAEAICQWLNDLIEAQHAVAVHCKAGLGRTGTVLAMYLIWLQKSVICHSKAIEWVRSKNQAMIQSEAQEEFLLQFSRRILVDPTLSLGV